MIKEQKDHENYFDNISIISILGRGSYGTVYKVYDKINRKCFAMKEVRIDIKNFDDAVNELLPVEIEHQNILKYKAILISKRPCKIEYLENKFEECTMYNRPFRNIKKFREININGGNIYEELKSDNISIHNEGNEEINHSTTIKSYKTNKSFFLEKYDDQKVRCSYKNLQSDKAIFDGVYSDMNLSDSLKMIDEYVSYENETNVQTVKPYSLKDTRKDGKLFKKSNNWNITYSKTEKKKRKTGYENEFFLYMETNICECSLRDFIDVRNKLIFQDYQVSQKILKDIKKIEHRGLLNNSVEIPVKLYEESVDKSNNVSRFFILNLFKYILLGLIHLHSLGISHNDLKPSNIFVDKYIDTYIPKLGDFGSRSSCNKHIYQTDDLYLNDRYQYLDPERKSCFHQSNDKIKDCRSLAPILFELLYPCKTNAELINLIRDLKMTKEVPKEFRSMYPEESKVIESILNREYITVYDILLMVERIIQTL